MQSQKHSNLVQQPPPHPRPHPCARPGVSRFSGGTPDTPLRLWEYGGREEYLASHYQLLQQHRFHEYSILQLQFLKASGMYVRTTYARN